MNRNASKYGQVGRGVPFPHHWLCHWARRGSTVGRERSLVPQRMIWRFAGKAWCGPGEGQNTQLGCSSMAASELHFIPPLLQWDGAKRDILGGCAPHPKAGPAVIPAASFSKGRLAWVSSLMSSTAGE